MPTVTTSNLSESFVSIRKQNSNCAEKSFLSTDFVLHMLMKGTMQDESRNLNGFITGNYLRNTDNDVVAYSHYGMAFDLIMNEQKVVMVSEGAELDVCPEDREYARETVESGGLNASYFINKTNKKIKSVLPSLDIKPIAILVGTQIREVTREQKEDYIAETIQYRTDNAYYQPSAQAITFLPHSQEFKEKGNTANYWEVPMVASHEYGHHIFSTIAPNTLITDQEMGSCFDGPQLDLPERKVEASTVISALNEGFADLMAFYTLAENERTLKGVQGLEKNREVDSSLFSSTLSKSFNSYTLAVFFAPFHYYTAENLQGIHNVGAIFAHSMDKFTTSLGANNDKKLEVTLTWLQEVNTRYPSIKTMKPADLLKELVGMYVSQAMIKTGKTYDDALCTQIESLYPGLKSTQAGCGTAAPTI